MDQPCPICGYQKNPGDSIFCMRCGNRVEITATSTTNSQFKIPSIRRQRASVNSGSTGSNSPVTTRYAGNNGYDPAIGGDAANFAYSTPSLTGDTSNIAYNSLLDGNTGNIGGYGVPPLTETAGNAGYGMPVDSGYSPDNNQQQVQQEQSASTTAEPAQMGSTSGSVSNGQLPRHAFAGRGSRVTHHSWLLEGEFANAAKLRSTVAKLLSHRCFRTLKLEMEKLYEQGYWPEEREYVVLQRGVTTVLLYIAPAGRDLYISRTTMAQPSFDPLRVFLLIFALGEVFFVPSALVNMSPILQASGSGGAVIELILIFIAAVLYIPVTLALITLLFASFKHWFVEKDFWIYLRRNTWNDFEVDDVMLLEHAADDTVRAAVELLKLDATKIVPPVAGYQPKHRIRLV